MIFISVFMRKMPFVVIFRPGTAQTGFFSSETSETGFSSSGRAQTGFFSWQSRLLAFVRLRHVFGFSSPVTSKLTFLRTVRWYIERLGACEESRPCKGEGMRSPLLPHSACESLYKICMSDSLSVVSQQVSTIHWSIWQQCQLQASLALACAFPSRAFSRQGNIFAL